MTVTTLNRPSRRGFTLVETMVALTIFGISLITAYTLMAGSLRNIRANREQAYVARLMESTIENVRNLSWAELTAQPATQPFDATKPLVPLFGKAINASVTTDSEFMGDHFSPAGTIHIETVSGQPDLRRVTVKVQHSSSASGSTAVSTLATLISRNGIDRR